MDSRSAVSPYSRPYITGQMSHDALTLIERSPALAGSAAIGWSVSAERLASGGLCLGWCEQLQLGV